MKQRTWIWTALILMVGGMAAYLLSRAEAYVPAGLCLMGAAVALFFVFLGRSGQLLDLEALFSLFWLGGVGVSALKLSKLATIWSDETWLCFGLAYVGFIAGYEGLSGIIRRRFAAESAEVPKTKPGAGRWQFVSDPAVQARRLKGCMLAVTGVSVACFLLEAVVLGFLPILSDKPHAYSEFHISGVHYFTVSCVLVPALCVLYHEAVRQVQGHLTKRQWALAGVCGGVSLALPIVMVSRFQLILALALAVIVWMRATGKVKLKYVLIMVAVLIPLYVGLTVARNHDVAYLNGIFEMKNEQTPIFITQPYMYIANNYDNFNCLVEQLPEHTHGMKMAFPIFVFTGLKFLRPEWVNFPLYITKTELTTVTLIYDAYYDFGVVGVAAFALVLGMLCCAIAELTKRGRNPIRYLLYGQAAMYLVLSFFTTWYTNPTTWFWYGMTVLCYAAVLWPVRKRRSAEKGA